MCVDAVLGSAVSVAIQPTCRSAAISQIHLGTQHESTEEGAHPFEQVRGQQRVDRVVDLPQPQQRDDAALRRVVAGELGPSVVEQLHVVGELSLQEVGGVGPADPQHTEER